jgi:hypothetical protein
MAELMVRTFITKGSKMSRVTLDIDNFRLLSQSGRAYASRGVDEPSLKRDERVKDAKGNYFDVFTVDGVKVYSGYDKNAGEGKTPNIFLINTEEAEKRHVPYDSTPIKEVELDMGDIIEEVPANLDNSLLLSEVE